jgi:hypothetical protein
MVVDHENDVKQNKEHYKSPCCFMSKNGFVICKNENWKSENIGGQIEALTKI